MKGTAALLSVAALASPLATNAQAAPVDSAAIQKCASIENSLKRLACYDDLARAFAPAAPTQNAMASGKWKIKSAVSPVDDTTTVTLNLDAESPIKGWPDKAVTPTLILRCKEKETESYIVTGMAPDVEDATDQATVTLRFDKEPAGELRMTKSTDGEALFFPDSVPFIKGMLGYSTLLFRFTPFNSSPVTTTFDIRGLREAVKPLREACHW